MLVDPRHKNLTIAVVTVASLLICFIPALVVPAEPKADMSVEYLTVQGQSRLTSQDLRQQSEQNWSKLKSPWPLASFFTDETSWSRIVIKGGAPKGGVGQAFYVECKYPFLHEVEMLLFEGDQLKSRRLEKRGVAPEAKTDRDMFFNFRIEQGALDRTVYLRTTAGGMYRPEWLVRDGAVFADLLQKRVGLAAALMGITSALLVHQLFIFMVLRTVAALRYFVVTLVYTVFSGVFLGYERLMGYEWQIGHELWLPLALGLWHLGLALVMQHIWYESRFEKGPVNLARMFRGLSVVQVVPMLAAILLPGATALVVGCSVSLVTILWLMALHMKYARGDGFFWMCLAHAVPVFSIVVTSAEVFALLPDTFYARAAVHVGQVWMGMSYAAASAFRLRGMRGTQEKISRALASEHAKTKLNRLLSTGYDADESLVESDVSIVFVDIVQFSLLAAKHTTLEVYRSLALRMREMITIVEQYGGVVDRSLGDGILCCFGYSGNKQREHHAVLAFRAAVALQELALQDGAGATLSMMMPTRIGLHSAKVMMGNLGDSSHLDLTIIGAGVNFASRLETACTPFKIMLSRETKTVLCKSGFDDSLFIPTAVAIKHQDSLVHAYEYDPFHDRHQDLLRAERAFLQQCGVSRVDQRVDLGEGAGLSVRSQLGPMSILDFSLHGFKTKSEFQLGRRASLLLRLVSAEEEINHLLREYFLQDLVGEVRWSLKQGTIHIHGFKIVGLSEERKHKLLHILTSARRVVHGDSNTSELIHTVA